jgi:hypothetical protein
MRLAHQSAESERMIDMVTRTTQTTAKTAPSMAPSTLAEVAQAIEMLKRAGIDITALASASAPAPAPAPKITPYNNVTWARVGDALFMVINANPAVVGRGTAAHEKGYKKLLAKIRETTEGHTLYTAGDVAVTLTAGISDVAHLPDTASERSPEQLASALLGVPMSAIAEMLAVYRKDTGKAA